MLNIIDHSLSDILNHSSKKPNKKDRIEIFLENHKTSSFSRKDYLNHFKDISTATASRDLKSAVANNLIEKFGEKKNSIYKIKSKPLGDTNPSSEKKKRRK